jgi:ABC-2 type transport system ATP-binding protein
MRRRANLAASLLHRPALLVLDEPTVGVDPQSRNAIFELVERLGAEGMAVLYTTHYMEEAERLCDRVGIIDSGRIVAEGTKRELVGRVRGQDMVRVHLSAGADRLAGNLLELGGVERAERCPEGVEVIAAEGHHLLRQILDRAEALDLTVTGLEVVEPDLEAVFLHLTGKALRD